VLSRQHAKVLFSRLLLRQLRLRHPHLHLCQSGKRQSPIDIKTEHEFESHEHRNTICVRSGEESSRPFRINYHYRPALNLSMVNNGYSLQVAGDFGFVTIGGCNPCDGQEYDVKQFHFHSPSEHTINNKSYAMELHIVHQKKGSSGLNDLVFVAVLFYVQPDGGFPNWFLDNINWANAPTTAGASTKISAPVDLHKLKESFDGEYWTYKGSLTTPPCSETVQYFIMKNPLGITKDQLATIQNLFSKNTAFANGNGNNRPVQKLNNREVVWYRRQHPKYLR
jgi:carbonic anhydrase